MSQIKGGVGHQGHPVLHITAPARRHPGGLNIQNYGKTPSCVLGPLVSPGLSLPALCLFRGPCYAGTWQTLYKYLLTNRLRFFLLFPFPTFCPRDTTLFPSIPPLPPSSPTSQPGCHLPGGPGLHGLHAELRPQRPAPAGISAPGPSPSPPGWARAGPPHTWAHVATQVRPRDCHWPTACLPPALPLWHPRTLAARQPGSRADAAGV